MAQGNFSNEEIDRMKADAMRRARQMQSRSSMPLGSEYSHGQNQSTDRTPTSKPEPPKQSGKEPTIINNIYSMIGALGLSHDQIILIALILLLAQEKDNIPLVIALLYIAM